MQPTLPTFAVVAADSEARALLPRLLTAKATLADVLAFGRLLRITATGKLLLTAQPAVLFADLERSALAMVAFLNRAGRDGVPASTAHAFFDAVACGANDAAKAIAAAARQTWEPSAEYEDDFLYARYLMDLHAGIERAAIAPILARYEVVLDGADDPRLDLCSALHARDSAAFERGLTQLVERLFTEYEERVGDDTLHPDEAVTTSLVSVEGLALVQLAHRESLTIGDDHLLLPSLARRIDLRSPLAPDQWQQLPPHGVAL